MQTEVRFICDSPAEAAQLLARLTDSSVGSTGVAGSTDVEKPKGKKGKTANVEATQPAPPPAVVDTNNILGLPAAAPSGDPLAALLNGPSAGQLPPAAMAQPAPAAPAAPTQQQVIQAVLALNQKHGLDAVKKLLAHFKADTVTAIKVEDFVTAIAAVKQALGQ